MKIKMLITTIAMFLLLSANGLVAQPPNSGISAGETTTKEKARDKIEALKRAYVITETQMTADEASKFWPLYEEYKAKRLDIKPSGGSGAETDRARADLKDEYYQKYLAIMSKEKVDLAIKALKDFRTQAEKIAK